MRLRLLVAYDGTDFSGVASSPGFRTVAGEIASALGRICGHAVTVRCAGRTDAGVHAHGQVLTVDIPAPPLTAEELGHRVGRMVGPEIAVRRADEAPDDFDVRRSAVARRYRYTILNRKVGDPLLRRTSWHVPTPELDIAAMAAASRVLHGTHDFSAFCRRIVVTDRAGERRELSRVREVIDTAWVDLGDGLVRFDIEGRSFCQQMVRSVVGSIVHVGAGGGDVGWFRAVLDSGDRSRAAPVAPAGGLCLWEVVY